MLNGGSGTNGFSLVNDRAATHSTNHLTTAFFGQLNTFSDMGEQGIGLDP